MIQITVNWNPVITISESSIIDDQETVSTVLVKSNKAEILTIRVLMVDRVVALGYDAMNNTIKYELECVLRELSDVIDSRDFIAKMTESVLTTLESGLKAKNQ